MIEILGIILASIVAVIMIMALIGYFMEKKQKSIVSSSSSVVLQDEIKENANSVTNMEIPDVMNFNDISSNLEKKENSFINVDNTVEVTSDNMVQNTEIQSENMVNSNAATNVEIPEVMNFNDISNDLENKEII